MNTEDVIERISKLQSDLLGTGTMSYQDFNDLLKATGSDLEVEYDDSVTVGMTYLHLQIMKKLLEDKEN